MLKKIKKPGLEEIYWLFRLGRPKRKATIYDIRQNPGEYIKNPVFFLSTGRCGTKWFTELLKNDKRNAVFHNPIPNFAIQAKLVFEIIKKKKFKPSSDEEKLIIEIFFSGREQYLRYSYKTEKRYVETNNHITFFTPVLNQIFPDARYIHLIRHPGEFVRSGLQRGYYSEKCSDEVRRIVPFEQPIKSKWNNYTQIQKIAWLWLQTNLYIEKCLKSIPSGQSLVFNFNDLSEMNVNKLVRFINSDISEEKIRKGIPKKVNIQEFSSVPFYNEWPDKEKKMVDEICGEYARQFDFQLL